MDQEVGQKKMAEKIQLKRSLKAVFAELQLFCLIVHAASVEKEAVQCGDFERSQCLGHTPNGGQGEKIEWHRINACAGMSISNGGHRGDGLRLVAASQENMAVGMRSKKLGRGKADPGIRPSN